MGPISDEMRYRVLRLLADRPEISQRELSDELGMSLGKANYCVRALVERGLVKVRNFTNSRNKAAYAYLLTPKGIEEKARVTVRFLKARMREYDAMAQEIERLRGEVAVAGLSRTRTGDEGGTEQGERPGSDLPKEAR